LFQNFTLISVSPAVSFRFTIFDRSLVVRVVPVEPLSDEQGRDLLDTVAGNFRPARVEALDLKDARGRIVGASTIVRDITEYN